MRPTTRRRSFALLSGIAAATVLAGCATSAATETDAGTDDSSTQTATDEAGTDDTADGTAEDTADDDAAATGSAYTDGTYDATGSYTSPGGPETVAVSLTLADGVVTAVEVTPEATNATSRQYQTQFASGIADEVVGVAIDDLDVTTVSGSSLTSGGFMDAVAQISADAAA
ncbi:FMN-binding protein [Cellulomonas oligotrophica]|uniref:Uncharacterized protein with FMN-binding domain n=1 Tax=Cellulomonas oligotrophica TaxID=931536 RepID=A0A7Y9FCW7_9CELL|nr:FMN-binding protein [Cellulomonas oligotrophica]NYD85044.1 uncharacterized protein with FMN-binding domain [Cellulomonas oligotrophica]GIG33749.1 hypothetical protein Col01nite_29080 [Cellulomonas oligotrophica]